MEKIYVNNLSETTDKYEVVRPLFDWNTLEVEFIYKSDFVITKDLRDFVEVTWETSKRCNCKNDLDFWRTE